MLSDKEFIRYSRQLMLPDFGDEGQLKLKQSRVVLIGCGGLGHAAAQYIVASGIGHLTLVDGDVVERSNLQRQILFREQDIGANKAKICAGQLKMLNPHCRIVAIDQHFTEINAEMLLNGCDWLLDCTDNFQSRLLINQLCQEWRISEISAAAITQQGQLMLWPFAKNQTLNYRTLFADVTDKALNCQSLGVLAPVVGVIGAMQALMLVQQILKPDSQAKFWQFDGVDWRLRNYQLAALDNFQSEPILNVSQAVE
jgi:molybdopterin/thiamine biosynthesis adenylyltransferase